MNFFFFFKNRSTESAADNVPLCEKAKAEGACGGNFTRYFYNKESGQCEEFNYSGCLGNNNRFMTMGECNAACGHKALEVKRKKTCGPPKAYHAGKVKNVYFSQTEPESLDT